MRCILLLRWLDDSPRVMGSPPLDSFLKYRSYFQVAVQATSDDEYGLRVEIEPEELFSQFIRVVKEVCKSCSTADAKPVTVQQVPADDEVSLTFCCQRNSFLLWNKVTDQLLTKIVCWNDTRSVRACDEWNQSMTVKVGSSLIRGKGEVIESSCCRVGVIPLHKAAAVHGSQEVVLLLGHGHSQGYCYNRQGLSILVFNICLFQSEELQTLLKRGELVFGCLDTWLLHRLSRDRVLVAEASNCSTTGMYDPYIGDYNNTILKLLGFPTSLLPPMVDSAIGEGIVTTDERHFGKEIRVVSVVCLPLYLGNNLFQLADQQAALYGCGCWNKGDTKISLGTGTFVGMNTGGSPHASMNGLLDLLSWLSSLPGLYPLVGWRANGKDTFVAEGNDNNTATLLQWAQNIGIVFVSRSGDPFSSGLFDSVESTSQTATEAGDTHGVVFIPAFNGLQTPINDGSACSGFLGLKPDTSKAHM